MVRVNGRPLHLVEPQCLRFKVITSFLVVVAWTNKHRLDPNLLVWSKSCCLEALRSSFYLLFYLIVIIKLEEPILLLGRDKFSAVDIRIRVKGGGHVAQVYG